MRTIIRFLALSAFLLGGAAFGQPPAPTKPDDPPKEKKPSQLEELLAEALRSNPDVRVAEAKFREAEAELNRARMLALQKVVAAQHTVDAASNGVKTAEAGVRLYEAKLEEAKTRLQRAAKLQQSGAAPVEDVEAAKHGVLQAQADLEITKASLQAAKANVGRTQAQMPYLIGKTHSYGDAADEARERLLHARELTTAYEYWLLKPKAEFVPPQGTAADKLRKALDKPVALGMDDGTVQQYLDSLADWSGVSLVNTATNMAPTAKIHLRLNGEVPLGAIFQALEDATGYHFAVRDYGILAVDRVPQGMMPLRTFWKGETTGEKPKAETPAKPRQSQTNPPGGN